MRLWPRLVYEWGATPGELDAALPCDELMPAADARFDRAVEARAPSAAVFRWLCQLRAAPYSYDLIDNLGRRSPRTLTPGLDRLETGQRMMTFFRLASFEPGRSITVTARTLLFGDIACTYRVEDAAPEVSRLHARVLVTARGRLRAVALHTVLGPGDLVMMRRQLLNLAELAGGTG